MREEKRAATSPLVGTTLGDAYRIVRQIGEGAMGGIYEARQLRLDKRVAVKILARELAANGEALLRFHREAEITSQLGHPHIITVFDFGTTDGGQPYLVMEFLEGEDLANRLGRVKTMPLAAAVRVAKQVASALSETHNKGVVHRDLKPANVFLSRIQGEDFAKVLDFGISKVRAASTSLTNASTLMGTPMYMAPEQAKGAVELDHWTDQWALACITYEMLTGRPPFIGDDTAALLYMVVHEDPPPPSQINANLPPEIDHVIKRALTKDQAERFPHVTAFARALEAAAAGKMISVEPTDGRGSQASVAAASLTPVEAAATLAHAVPAYVPRQPRRRAGHVVLWGGFALVAIIGVFLVRGALQRPADAPTVVAAPAVTPGPAEANEVAGDPAPAPAGTAAAANNDNRAATAETNEPAAVDDGTGSAPPKDKAAMTTSTPTSSSTSKSGASRRRPGRRAAGPKRAAAPGPSTTPAQNAPVKRKLINDL
jgi:tRNA A-37 threonylcarbamoyl transferase component Bud32